MQQKIIAFSGRKQSGKNTCLTAMQDWFDGVGEFSFAAPLKRMCMEILGLTYHQCYGTDEDKNTPVPHLLWENFPVPVWDMPDGSVYVEDSKFDAKHMHYSELYTLHALSKRLDLEHPHILPNWPVRKTGPMTGREVMQYWGSDIFRRAYGNVWADACIRSIKNSSCRIAVITDLRFPNEFEAVKAAGGLVVRLTRVEFKDDNHISETALDADKFDWERFGWVFNNADMTIEQQDYALNQWLVEHEIV